MLIDFHTHTQPSVAAADAFFRWVGRDQPPNPGDVGDLLRKMAANGVSRTLIVPWLPAHDLVAARVAAGEGRAAAERAVIDQWKRLNAWAARAASERPDELSALVGVDPVLMQADEIRAEVAERLATGACGLKIAPMFLDVPASDPRIDVVWEEARRHGVFVLSECGARGALGHEAWGHPRYFDAVARRFPEVRIMLAHLGMGAEDEVARLVRTHRNLYADLSLRLTGVDEPGGWTSAQLLDVIRAIGADRVVYGTNFPLVDTAAYAATFRRLELTGAERELIGWRNAASLLVRRPPAG